MKKIDLNERLNKTATIICIVAVIVFVLVGCIVASVIGQKYYSSLKSEILNYKNTASSGDFYMTTDGYLVFKYNGNSIDLNKVCELSNEGAIYVRSVLDENKTSVTLSDNKCVINTNNQGIYYVFFDVINTISSTKQSYRLILVEKEDFDSDKVNNAILAFENK